MTHPPLVSSTLGYKLTGVETSVRADTKLEPWDIDSYWPGIKEPSRPYRLYQYLHGRGLGQDVTLASCIVLLLWP